MIKFRVYITDQEKMNIWDEKLFIFSTPHFTFFSSLASPKPQSLEKKVKVQKR